MSFAPHAIDNDRFAFKRDEETLLLRKSLSLGENDILILFAGKLEEKKAPQHLLAAFLSINKPNVHLLFAGNGPLENELKQTSGDNARVHFMEFQNQSQMPVVYQACDLFCLPSVGPGETWGLAINEAMACSKAIIASSKVGCAVDLVKDGVNGAVFEAGNISDLTSKLQELTHDVNRLKTYGEESQKIIKDWNFTKIAEAIENKLIYETD